MMKTPIRHAVGLAIALLGCGSAWSLDLSQAYDAALAQDATVRASRAAADVGREKLPQARAQLLPQITASGSRLNNRLTSTQPNPFGGIVTTQDAYVSTNKTLTIRQPLYRPYNFSLYRQAKAQVEDANALLDKDLQNLIVRVGGAYFDALLAEEQLALVTNQKNFYTSVLDAAKKAFAAGSGIRTDIDDAQARLDMTVAQELEARQNVSQTRRQLEAFINQPVDKLAALEPARMVLLPPDPARVEDWVEKAEQVSPEIRSGKAQVEIFREEVAQAQAGHLPTLDAIAQWSRSSSENIVSIHSAYDNKSVGVQLSVPIFGGGYVSSQVRQAQADLTRVQETLEGLRRDLGIRIYAQFRGVSEGVLKVKALEQAVRSAEQSVQSNRRAFQAGSRTQIDVLNSEQQRMNSLRDLAEARYVYLVSRLRLLALTGTADIDIISQINGWLKP